MKGDFRVDERSAMWNLPRWEGDFIPQTKPHFRFLGHGKRCLLSVPAIVQQPSLKLCFREGCLSPFFFLRFFMSTKRRAYLTEMKTQFYPCRPSPFGADRHGFDGVCGYWS